MRFISAMLAANENNTFAFAITVNEIVIGSIGVFRQENIHKRTAELGYYIAEDYWGKGIDTQMMTTMLELLKTGRNKNHRCPKTVCSMVAGGEVSMNKAGTQRIETQRLILRRFKIEDAEDMYTNWASDTEVTRYLTWPVHSNVEITRSLLTEWVSHYSDGGYFNWVMEYKETGKAIGNISVVKLHENTEAADIGYCMSRAYWGHGLMPEALKGVMAYLFDVVGLNRIAACHDVNNPKSGRVMDKAGMKREGILRAAGMNNLGICDEVWHAAIREDRDPLSELAIELQDTEWPFEFTDHDRMIVRAICFDDNGYFYFVRAERDDDFGKATLIETSGGGVEAGEDLQSAIKRELKEELGADVDVIGKIGVVSDYYNLLHRHNINNYFICRIVSFGDKNLTKDEIEDFHLSTLKMTYEEAAAEYEKRRKTGLGRLIANRELPVLRKGREIIDIYGTSTEND